MKGKHPEFNVDFPAYSMARFLEHMRDIQYHDVLIDEPDLMTEVYQESISVYDSLANKVDLETTEIEFVRELYEKYLNTFDGISIPFCLIHSDMTEKNLIVDDDNKLSIIDWDGLQIDDPVYEMGVFPYLIFREILRHYDRELGERVEERYWFHRLRREILGVHYCTSPTYADKLEFHIAKFRNRVREYRLFNNT
jgi:thiamine kinase-like enzyme